MITTRRPWSEKKSAFVIWGSVLSASVFVSLFTSARLPAVHDVALRQPLTLLAGVLLATLLLKFLLRLPPKETWQGILYVLPAALVIGVLGALTGFWNDGSGVQALPSVSAATFVFTGGLFPRLIGPEALMRIAFLALSVLLGVRIGRKGKGARNGMIAFAVAWFSSATVMLIPTWMAMCSAWLRRFPLVHSRDAVRALGYVHTDSYWSSFQADRFFAGIGNELVTASSLSTSAVLLTAVLVILFVLGWKKGDGETMKLLRSQFAVMKRAEALFLLSGALGGFVIGVRGHHFTWGDVDMLAIILLLCAIVSLILLWIHGKELEFYDASLLVAILAGALLGWPALVLVLAFLFVAWLLSLGEFDWRRSIYGRAGALSVLMLFAVALGGVVGSRSPLYPHALSGWIAAWAILVGAATILRNMGEAERKNMKRLIPAAAVAAIGFLPILSPVVLLALFALYLLSIHFSLKKPESWDRNIVWASLLFAWAASLLSYLAL